MLCVFTFGKSRFTDFGLFWDVFKVGFGEGRLLGSGSRDLDVLEHRRNLGKVEFSSVFLSFSSKV